MSDAGAEAQNAAYEREVAELRDQAKVLEEEVLGLRRRMQDAPKRVRTLEEKLLETKGQLQQAISQNERLTFTLREAREHIAALREEVDKLTQPPSAYGTFLARNDDGTVDVFSGGRKMRVALHPELALEEESELRRGAEVVLNESLNVVLARSAEQSGRGGHPQGAARRRAGPSSSAGPTRSGWSSWPTACRGVKIRSGDSLLMDSRTGLLLEKLPRPEVEELVLEEVPDISYADVGGLDDQIEAITDAVELPFLYRELFVEHKLPAPKGILLYGPPGLRQDPHRQGGGQLPGQARWPRCPATRRPAATSSTSRAPSCSTSTWARPSARSAWSSSGPGRRARRACRSSSSSTRWTRFSAPGAPASARTWSRRSCPSCWPRSTVSRPCAT